MRFVRPSTLKCLAQIAKDGTLKRSLSLLGRGVSSMTYLGWYITNSLFCSVRITATSCRRAVTLGDPAACGAYDGTFHHMSPKHMCRYVNEFAVKTNNRYGALGSPRSKDGRGHWLPPALQGDCRPQGRGAQATCNVIALSSARAD